jgi:hypothetical protein
MQTAYGRLQTADYALGGCQMEGRKKVISCGSKKQARVWWITGVAGKVTAAATSIERLQQEQVQKGEQRSA